MLCNELSSGINSTEAAREAAGGGRDNDVGREMDAIIYCWSPENINSARTCQMNASEQTLF